MHSAFSSKLVSRAIRMARVNEAYHTALPATHTFIHEWNEQSCFYSQPQRTTALWPVLISRPAEGRRLSWPGWLVCPPEEGAL